MVENATLKIYSVPKLVQTSVSFYSNNVAEYSRIVIRSKKVAFTQILQCVINLTVVESDATCFHQKKAALDPTTANFYSSGATHKAPNT